MSEDVYMIVLDEASPPTVRKLSAQELIEIEELERLLDHKEEDPTAHWSPWEW